jgi:hypothetical protein
MPQRIPSRVRRFASAGTALFTAGILANACSLNPQPLPPDQPTDASSGFGSAPQTAVDGGVNKGPGQPDATIPAVDSGAIPVAQDGAAPADAGAGPDAGRSADGGGVDGGSEGGDADAAPSGSDGAPSDAGVQDGAQESGSADAIALDGTVDGEAGDAGLPSCSSVTTQNADAAAGFHCSVAQTVVTCSSTNGLIYCLEDGGTSCSAAGQSCSNGTSECSSGEYGVSCPCFGPPGDQCPQPPSNCRGVGSFPEEFFFCCPCSP